MPNASNPSLKSEHNHAGMHTGIRRRFTTTYIHTVHKTTCNTRSEIAKLGLALSIPPTVVQVRTRDENEGKVSLRFCSLRTSSYLTVRALMHSDDSFLSFRCNRTSFIYLLRIVSTGITLLLAVPVSIQQKSCIALLVCIHSVLKVRKVQEIE
jgi:hypothetical protein